MTNGFQTILIHTKHDNFTGHFSDDTGMLTLWCKHYMAWTRTSIQEKVAANFSALLTLNVPSAGKIPF